jgi:hypothetical protein
MGLLEVITGRRKLKGPAPDRLFAITTAAVQLQAGPGIEPAGEAAIVFQALATPDFEAALRDTEDVVKATGADTGTTLASQDDAYGYRWMVLHSAGVEDLAVGINAVSGSIETAGHGERLLCAVFAFDDASKRRLYFIYNYKRGLWYPFVPRPGSSDQRDTERELQVKAQIGPELPIEPELERWFPLWGIPI